MLLGEGGQEEPFPAATRPTVPFPPTRQRTMVNHFSSIMRSDGLSLCAPTDPNGVQGCIPH